MDSHRISVTTPPSIPSGSSFFSFSIVMDVLNNLTTSQRLILLCLLVLFLVVNLSFFRLANILSRSSKPRVSDRHAQPTSPSLGYLLIVLGSGGHTAEMLNILSNSLPLLQVPYNFPHRTYVISSGDSFSAQKAHEFESSLSTSEKESGSPGDSVSTYNVVTVHRARKVHQSLLTAPISSLRCLWDCIQVLKGTHADLLLPSGLGEYPDIILTNGPGTGVIVILASIILLFFNFSGSGPPSPATSIPQSQLHRRNDSHQRTQPGPQAAGQMRSIYIESWARVQTLSLSGRLLKPFVDRFIVQWPQLVEKEGSRVEYIGPLVT